MLSVEVAAGGRFAEGERLTAARLNALGTPTCTIVGDASADQIADSSVTEEKTDFNNGVPLPISYADIERMQLLTMIRDPITLTYSAVVDLNFGSNVGGLRRVTLAGNVQFTTTNLNLGRDDVWLHIIGDGSARELLFPSEWKWFGGPMPTRLGVNRAGLLRLSSLGTTNAEVRAEWLGEELAPGTLAYGATVTVEFGQDVPVWQTLTLAGNVIFATGNLRPGTMKLVRVVGDAAARTIASPAGWKWVGDMTAADVSPSGIGANEVGLLILRSFGTSDAEVVAEWLVTFDASVTMVASGTYTPTGSVFANMDTLTVSAFKYLRVGNVVEVSGFVTCNATTASLVTEFLLSLPIPTVASLTDTCVGMVALKRPTGGSILAHGRGEVGAGAVVDKIKFTYVPVGVEDNFGAVHFSYSLV